MSVVNERLELPARALERGPGIYDPRPIMFRADIFEQAVSLNTDLLADEGVKAALTPLAEVHDRFTLTHLYRVGLLTGAMAVARGLDEAEQRQSAMAGLLHDCGKHACQHIIYGQSPVLSSAEWPQMERHTIEGERLVRAATGNEAVAGAALGHHEFNNLRAYPRVEQDYLTDDQKTLLAEDVVMGAFGSAQVTAVADSLDAGVSQRPNKPAQTLLETYAWQRLHFTGNQELVDILYGQVYELPLATLDQYLDRHHQAAV